MKADRILPLMSDTINLILHLMLHTEFALTRACVCVSCVAPPSSSSAPLKHSAALVRVAPPSGHSRIEHSRDHTTRGVSCR